MIKHHYKSQCGQDEFFDKFVFSRKKNGFFLDIGAFDGVHFSNSVFFEQARNWQGVCVEPNPDAYEKLIQSRSATAMNCAVGTERGSMPFRKLSGESAMLSGLVDLTDSRHKARVDRESKMRGESSEIIDVDVLTINEIIEKNDLKRIDYMSIDTEGGEIDILESLNQNEFSIDSLSIEFNFDIKGNVKRLRAAGYRPLLSAGVDVLAVRKGGEFDKPVVRLVSFGIGLVFLAERLTRKLGVRRSRPVKFPWGPIWWSRKT